MGTMLRSDGVAFPGHPLGNGLTAAAAKELSLLAGSPVGTSLIDAHAGGVGVMESKLDSDSLTKESDVVTLCSRMVLACGTSTYHMAVSREKLFIPGVWGLFWSEGGQSATGALLDHIIENHVASPRLANGAASQKVSVFELLNNILKTMAEDMNSPFIAALTSDMHILPDFHGNRSSVSDPNSKGIIFGMTLDTTEKQLALLYITTVQGIAYGYTSYCRAL